MEKKTASAIMLTLLLASMLTLAFNIQPVKAEGTIYIRADGSIDPPDAPISTVDYVTYTLTGNITSDADGVVVERSNIIIDGADYTVEGSRTYPYIGIYLSGVNNATIKNVNVTYFHYGIYLNYSSNNNISGDSITNNGIAIYLHSSSDNNIVGNSITANGWYSIWLDGSSNNSISGNGIGDNYHGMWFGDSSNNSVSGNKITGNSIAIHLNSSSNNNIVGNSITANNWYGILLGYSSNNRIYHNNFEDNHPQVYGEYSTNVWDDGYPLGGNYWSDYAGVDEKSGLNQDQSGRDGIGDAPYFISEHPYTTRDRYPLRSPFSTFHAGTWNGTAYDVDVVSNSTVSDFHFNPYEGAFLKFKVTGEAGTRGFCRVTIPRGLLWTEDGWVVLVDGEPVDYSQIQDENFTYLYSIYIHSTHEIQIIGTHVTVPPPLTYSLTITTTVGGIIDPAPGTYSYTANSTVQVTAIPNAGYLFDYWDLDGVNVGSANPYSVLMNKNHTLKAIFSHIKPAVPVGGYSIPIQVQTKAEPIIPYIALIATLTAIFIKLKPKTKRKHRQ